MTARALVIGALLLVAPDIGEACSCPAMPPCQAFWMADAVFTGVVTDITWSERASKEGGRDRYSHTTFVVERGFRGASGQVVVRGWTNSSCHYDFTIGRRYLVYARQADGALTTADCSGNKLLADAGADLDYAENLPPPGIGGRIYGGVKVDTDLLEARNPDDRFVEVIVTLRDAAGGTIDLRPGVDGKFEAAGLQPGSYSLSVAAPKTTTTYFGPKTIELKDRACAPVFVSVVSNGRIVGRIVDRDGRPVRDARVSALPTWFTSRKEFSNARLYSDSTDAAGRYEIGPVPPDRYHVGVNVEFAPTFKMPFAPTFFSGRSQPRRSRDDFGRGRRASSEQLRVAPHTEAGQRLGHCRPARRNAGSGRLGLPAAINWRPVGKDGCCRLVHGYGPERR